MSKKKSYDSQSREREYGRNKDGLKQRRLKEENRWKFNPNQSYDEFFEKEEYYDEDNIDLKLGNDLQ